MASRTVAVINGTSRTFKHLIPQALAKGHKVRAIVRSASKFLSQTKKHDDLSAHEWSNFNDLDTLSDILDGVDVVFVALGAAASALLKPSHLNEDTLIAVGTVLLSKLAPDSRSKTKVVLLSSYRVTPDAPRIAMIESILGNQFNDLRRAQDYLRKQAGWLDVIYIAPGMLVDSEEVTTATDGLVRLTEGEDPKTAISYSRLAASMLEAAIPPTGEKQDEWVGKRMTPIPTSKVPVGLKDFASARETFGVMIWHSLLPWAFKRLGLALLGAGLGYVIGAREQGAWLLDRFGVSLTR